MRAERRLKNRKGVFVVLFAILFMALMATAAMSVDFSRIWAMRNELQTSADASSLAGAFQFRLKPNNTDADIANAVTNYAAVNPAMGAAVVIDSIIIGNWTDTPSGGADNWTPLCAMVGGTCQTIGTPPSPPPTKNAVRTVVSHPTNGLIMSGLGIAAPTVHAGATAWADAAVANTGCIKPWSIPYVVLMYRINKHRNIPSTPENLQRAWDQVEDMKALNEMTDAERTFTLKQGAQGANDPYPDSTNAPGNFQRIQLPKYYDAATNQYNPFGTSNGTNDYKDAIGGSRCHTLGIGDKLQTLPGNAPEPTLDAVVPNVCSSLVDDKNSPTNGNCINSSGGVGADVKAAFHLCTDGCSGMSLVEVKMLGSFTLTKVYPNGQNSNSAPAWDPDGWDKAEIQGIFKPVGGTGVVGGGPSMITTIILVR